MPSPGVPVSSASLVSEPSPSRAGSEFAPLMHLVRDRGLLRTRRLRYAVSIAVDLLAFAGVWAAVWALGRTWWTLLLTVPLALFTTRIVFVGHDVGHEQVARTTRVNGALGVLVGDFLSGLGSRWWIDKHNRHHANPNCVESDPDVGAGALVWTREQAHARGSGIGRWAARHQASLYFPMLLLEALNLKMAAVRAVRGPRQAVPLLLHVGVYLGALVLIMGPGRAAVFVFVHHALVGLHLGVAFAPNHKGMEMPEPGVRRDFLRRQVPTSRNVSGGRAIDWFLGGLHFQIEHHLFPSMPRHSLRRAQPVIRAYCTDLGVPYAQASLPASMRLTLRHLREVGVDRPDDEGRAPQRRRALRRHRVD
ncbi:MAG: fatty acid desaturase family protein [Sporichthyaceae bacterium]